MFAATPGLVEAVLLAAVQFEHYAELHRAKGTREGHAKAEINASLARTMRAALPPPNPTPTQ